MMQGLFDTPLPSSKKLNGVPQPEAKRASRSKPKAPKEQRVYTLRDENRFKLDPEFVRRYIGQQPAWGYGLLSYVTYKRTYARRVDKKQLADEAQRYLGVSAVAAEQIARTSTQTTEEYWQTCVRVVEGVSSVLKQHVRDTGQPWSDEKEQEHAQEMFRRIWAFKFTPPGRGLWGMGTEALELKGSGILNNCGFVSTEHLSVEHFDEPFVMLMDYSMLGVGMGFDLLGADKVTLQKPIRGVEAHVIPDTREGWIGAVQKLLRAFVGKDELPGGWDYSKIRKEGKPLRTFGGTASGPGPLKRLLMELERLCLSYVDRKIDGAFIVDVMNLIGVCVVAGNVRRSSEISLGDPDDATFLALKDNTQQNELYAKLAQIADSIPGVQKEKKAIARLQAQRAKLNLSVLDKTYSDYQSRIDRHQARITRLCSNNPEWAAIDAQIRALPINNHRWASNNTVLCKVGKTDYSEIVPHTLRNGEPGYGWPEVFRQYGRLIDPPNNKDRQAKGFNPCVPAGTRILTRNGYQAIDTLLDRSVDVWNGESWASVTPKVTGHDQPLVRVELSDGTSLVCTEYHKWHLAPKHKGGDEEVVRAIDLQPGDTLAKFAMPIVETGCDWAQAYTHGFFCGDGQVNAETGSKSALLYGVKQRLVSHLDTTSVSAVDAYDRVYVGLPRGLPDKYVVRHDLSVAARLAWLAGLFDADGCVLRNPNSVCLQLTSINRAFLLEVRLMLTTLGVQAKVTEEREATIRSMPDGKGGHADYACQSTYRLLINAADTHQLVRLGMKTHRLDLPNLRPQRDARRFVSVEAVEKVGSADVVYCFEEPITHRGTFEGIVTGQCGEQTLHDGELCCLVETYPTKNLTLDDFLTTLKYAYRYAKAVTLIPTHNQKTNAVMVRNRRIGTSMAGIIEMYSKLGMQECIEWWNLGYAEICKWDTEYSAWLGVNESIKKTSIKPGGTTPLLVGVEGGMKLPTDRYYMRTIRIDHISPLVEALRNAGYRVEPDRTTPRTMVVYFPAKAPDDVRLATDMTLWEQAALFTALQRHWSDNMVSATLTFQASEAKDVARVLEVYEGQWKCVSFLPYSSHGFPQAPYIPCTKEEYEAARSRLAPVRYDGLVVSHDTDDKFCSGGLCEARIESST
jgi:hypothetical protein